VAVRRSFARKASQYIVLRTRAANVTVCSAAGNVQVCPMNSCESSAIRSVVALIRQCVLKVYRVYVNYVFHGRMRAESVPLPAPDG
jgi:hypothetical protein